MTFQSSQGLRLPLLVLLLLVGSVAGWRSHPAGGSNHKKHALLSRRAHVMEKGVQEQLDYVRSQLTAFLKARDEFSTMQDQLKDRFKST